MPKLRHPVKFNNPKTKVSNEVVLEGLQSFGLMQHHKYSLTELENMIPFEREIYVGLLVNYIKEEKEKEQARKNKQRG